MCGVDDAGDGNCFGKSYIYEKNGTLNILFRLQNDEQFVLYFINFNFFFSI